MGEICHCSKIWKWVATLSRGNCFEVGKNRLYAKIIILHFEFPYFAMHVFMMNVFELWWLINQVCFLLTFYFYSFHYYLEQNSYHSSCNPFRLYHQLHILIVFLHLAMYDNCVNIKLNYLSLIQLYLHAQKKMNHETITPALTLWI